MRYCRFQTKNGPRFGKIERVSGEDVIAGLLTFPEDRDSAAQKEEEFDPFHLKQARLFAPVLPSKIVCVGRNYRDHASELGNEVPVEPLIFFKPPSSIIGPNEIIQLPPDTLTKRVDFEGELGVVIGKRCSKLTDGAAVREYIRGYTCVNDVTARDLQKTDGQWTRAKGFDTFCPVGPIVSDEIDALTDGNIEIATRLNGEQKQAGHVRDFIFALDVVIRYISRVMTLEPGDLLSTGTPAGVGPMKMGDLVDVSVSGLGILRNKVV